MENGLGSSTGSKNTNLKIVLIGSGNLAFHLGKTLSTLPGYPLVQVYARSVSQARALGQKFKCKATHKPEDIEKNAGLYIICVTDDQVASVGQSLAAHLPQASLVVHTSGSTSSLVLAGWFPNSGVLYPLQTFTKDKKIAFSTIPWLISGTGKKTTELLQRAVGIWSKKVVVVNDEARLRLHLCAVLVNNFPNFIYDLANRFLDRHGLEFDWLIPLMEETLAKVKSISPVLAQTGPAKRHDKGVIDLHLALLKNENEEDLYQIYKLLSEMIWKKYPVKL